MKRIALFLLAVIGFVFSPLSAFAAVIVTLENYFYAHANQPGTFYFKDRYNIDRQYGDNFQKDAVITGLRVSAQGLAEGDQILVQTGSGQSYPVTPGEQLSLNVGKTDYIRIALVKSGNNEVFAKLDEMITFDDSDGGTTVKYNFSVNDIPTEYGDLGPGTLPGDDTAAIVTGNYYYFEPRDAYRYDYNPPSGVAYYQLHFDSPSGEHYYRQFDQAPTGVHYLTCNGTYVMRFFNASGQVIAKSETMTTGQIQAPTCNSQPDNAAGYNDITATINLGGSICTVIFNDIAADFYEIYRNGQYIIGVQGLLPPDYYSQVVEQIPCVDGSYTLIAIKNGSIVGQKDFQQHFNSDPGGGDPGGGDPGGGSCGVCEKLAEMLQCPGWDVLMGDLTDAIRDALPPPPDWDLIADKIGAATIRHLADYLGDVPTAPTYTQIKNETTQTLPTVDNSVPASNQLTPAVPADFNTPKPFDISSGPQIAIVDESAPFVLTDPLSNLQIDAPGVPVYPGDSRNSSGGIKTPDNVNTGGPAIPTTPPSQTPPTPGGSPDSTMPTPAIPESGVPDPVGEVPENPMPIPSGGGQSDMPMPDIPDSIIPIPRGEH